MYDEFVIINNQLLMTPTQKKNILQGMITYAKNVNGVVRRKEYETQKEFRHLFPNVASCNQLVSEAMVFALAPYSIEEYLKQDPDSEIQYMINAEAYGAETDWEPEYKEFFDSLEKIHAERNAEYDIESKIECEIELKADAAIQSRRDHE